MPRLLVIAERGGRDHFRRNFAAPVRQLAVVGAEDPRQHEQPAVLRDDTDEIADKRSDTGGVDHRKHRATLFDAIEGRGPDQATKVVALVQHGLDADQVVTDRVLAILLGRHLEQRGRVTFGDPGGH